MRTGSRAFLAPARPGPAALLCSQVLCPPAERPPAEADTWLGPAVGPAQGLLRSSVSASASAGLTPGVNLVRWVQGGGGFSGGAAPSLPPAVQSPLRAPTPFLTVATPTGVHPRGMRIPLRAASCVFMHFPTGWLCDC